MARKEVVVGEVGKLMRDTKHIRNMAIVAHVDHGKCVSGDTRIVLSDGRVMTARDLFGLISQTGSIARQTSDEIVFDAGKNGLKVFSLNKESGKIEEKKLSHAWKLEGGKVLRVGLRNGVSISTTPEHKYVVLGESGFAEKTAGELAVGDSVVCAKKLSVNGATESELKEAFIDCMASEKFYFRLTGEFGAWLANALNQLPELEKLVLFKGLQKEGVAASLKEFRLRSAHLAAVCKRLGVPLSIAYDKIESVVYRGGNARWGKNAKLLRLPSDFESFFYLAGLLFGDGHEDKLVVGKPELGEIFAGELQKLGIAPVYRNYPYRTSEISAGSKTLLKLLECVFEYPAGKKSHIIHASQVLFSAPERCVSAFLRAYFDCDGTVEKARRAVSLSSASARMLADVQLLLLRFNVASIKQGNTLYVTGNSVKRFNEKIGFAVAEKQRKATELQEKVVGSYVLDVIPFSSRALNFLRQSSSMSSVAHNYYEYETKGVKPTVASVSKMAAKLDNRFLDSLCCEELAFLEVTGITEGFEKEVFDFTVEDNHNFVAEGVVIHNTTLSDSLLAVAGLISRELAGEQRVLDYDPQEQARGITIKAANISLGFEYEGIPYIINMIDTPGHVDFGGHVTRAMRAVDGVILVVDSVEAVMPQTETVLRQALKEKVKPVLFINKIDRLINELKLDSKGMQERFIKIIDSVNKLIEGYGPEEFKKEWKIDVTKGNVAFGTGFNKWAVSSPIMKKTNLKFDDLYKLCAAGDHKTLREKAPIEEVILEMAVRHLPNPGEAQKYRIPVIWKGDQSTVHGKAMMTCDANGPVCFMVTAVQVDEHAGEVAIGRLYSGTVAKGKDIYLAGQFKSEKLQNVAIYMGPDRVLIDEVPAGNIVALIGLHDIYAGETASEGHMAPFEQIKHHSEPVVTKSIEAKNPRDLVKLIEILQKLSKEDPTIRVEINPETGEHLLSGMGELHLEIVEYKIEKERGVEIETSPPIVVYHEAIVGESPELEGKSPNKHNKFKLEIKPLEASVVKAIKDGEIDDRTKGKDLIERLIKAGLDRDEAKKVLAIHRDNIFIDATKGVQYLQDIKELMGDAFAEAVDQGPLAREKAVGVKVLLTDATIHVDPAHRGPAQIYPAVRRPIYAGMLMAKTVLLEPKQKLYVNAPQEYMSGIINLIQGRRGQVLDIQQEGEAVAVTAKVPVATMFGFASEIRGASQGRAAWYYEYEGYEKLPESMQAPTIAAIRKRKGEPEVAPTAKDFMD